MSIDVSVLRPWSIVGVAGALELHPFEVVRLLAKDGSLPRDLRLRPQDVARIVELGGLEVWWSPQSVATLTSPSLVRALARELLVREVVEPIWTRADNLFRGLDAGSEGVVRRAVNVWIRSGAMGSRMSARGLELSVRAAAVADLRALAEAGSGAYTGLLEETDE